MKNSIEIKTNRLLLRPVSLENADAIFKYRSDSITNKFQGWIPKTINDVYEFIKHRVASEIDVVGTWFQFTINLLENNKLIGDVGIHFFDFDKQQVEIGFTLDKNQHGKGYATECVTAMINFLIEKLNKRRIIASIDPGNVNSIKLVERLGFRKEAHFKESIFANGQWHDDLVYAILKNEWMKNH